MLPPLRLQSLALQCAEKLSAFVEANERIVDFRQTGGFAVKGDRKDGAPYGARRGGGRL